MNKQQWKLQHSANRRIYHGLFSTMSSGERGLTDSESFKVASTVVWRIIDKQHPSFKYALQPNRNVVYQLPLNRWAAKHNTTAFNDIRERNYIDKISRQLEK